MVEKIKKLNDLGVTNTTIAKGIGCGRSTITNWLSGVRFPNEDNERRFEAWLKDWKDRASAI